MENISNPKLLVKVRQEIRNCQLSENTENAYIDWIFRFLMFHPGLNQSELTEKEINTFLSFLAVRKQASSSTQNQALHAVLFLYRRVLNIKVNNINFIRLKKRVEVPVVFTRDEIRKILDHLSGEKKLIISLLYGCGLNLNECLSLRIQDIDLKQNKLHIINHRTHHSRDLSVPDKLREELKSRIELLRYQYMHLSLKSFQGVTIPDSINKISPEAGMLFSWFYLFPTSKPAKKNETGKEIYHHRSETYVQKVVRKILTDHGVKKSASCRSFRHSFATHLLKEGMDIYELQKLLGHKNIRNTMVYKQVLKMQSQISTSPLDNL